MLALIIVVCLLWILVIGGTLYLSSQGKVTGDHVKPIVYATTVFSIFLVLLPFINGILVGTTLKELAVSKDEVKASFFKGIDEDLQLRLSSFENSVAAISNDLEASKGETRDLVLGLNSVAEDQRIELQRVVSEAKNMKQALMVQERHIKSVATSLRLIHDAAKETEQSLRDFQRFSQFTRYNVDGAYCDGGKDTRMCTIGGIIFDWNKLPSGSKFISIIKNKKEDADSYLMHVECSEEALEKARLTIQDYPEYPFPYFVEGYCKEQIGLGLGSDDFAKAKNILKVTVAPADSLLHHDFILEKINEFERRYKDNNIVK